jgi:formyltetrahydrofolate synthetase
VSAVEARGDGSTIKPIADVAREIGLSDEDTEPFGRGVVKVTLQAIDRLHARAVQAGVRGRYVLVTATTPTRHGEGKTTTAVGLAEALRRIGHRAGVCVRQPSVGTVLGMRGGAAGEGRCQVLPAEDLNLGLTGDFDAVATAQNLAAAFLDNSMFHGNPHDIDPRSVRWPRTIEINDRALRRTTVGLGGGANGIRRRSEWVAAAVSEVMEILSLASDGADLRRRLGRIVLADDTTGHPVTVEDLGVGGAMAALLGRAVRPNLLQTSEGGPAFVHGGSWSHIGLGSSRVLADRVALATCDIVCTEAGYGSDLGAEKFFDIKCRASGLVPDAVVLVATVRALKAHGAIGGVAGAETLDREDVDAVRRGASNLAAHIGILRLFGLPVVVAVNAFPSDTEAEFEVIREVALGAGAVDAIPSWHFTQGGEGALDLASAVWKVASAPPPSPFRLLYPEDAPLRDKIEAVAVRVYGASGVDFSRGAVRALRHFEDIGLGRLAVCMAKTPYSLSDKPDAVGRPAGFRIRVHEARISAGAGFVTAFLSGARMMPELPARPRAEGIDVGPRGEILGLF